MMLIRFFSMAIMLFCSNMTFALNVELIETSPKAPVVLNQDEPLYVRIHYESKQPLRFQAIGSELGQSILHNVRLNPSQAYPAGEGEAIAWVSYYKVTEIDSIKVTVYNSNWQSLQTVSLPVSVKWQEGNSAATHPLAPWAKQLNQQQQASVGHSQESPSLMWTLLITLMFFSIPVYWLLQTVLIFRWSGKWRKLASFPLIVSLPLLAYTLYALNAGSNLWPLMMIFICPWLLIYLLIIIWHYRNTSVL